MATDNQTDLFRNLMRDKMVEPKGGYTTTDLVNEFAGLPFAEASRWLDKAKNLPDRDSGTEVPF